MKKLGELLAEYAVRNKKNIDYPVYSVTNSQGFCRDYFGKDVASQNKTTYKIVPRGYFAYNPSRINVGSVDWQREVDNAIVSPLYVVFGVSEFLRQDYLQYYLKCESTIKLIAAIATGTVRANLKFETLCSFSIPLPPLPEQEKIVAELDCLSGIIEKKKQQLKELEALAQSIFYEMFGDPVENEKGWEVKKLGEVGDIITGNTPSTKDSENYITEDFCFVKPSDIEKDSISFIENTENHISEKAYQKARKLKIGSVLTTCIGIIGKVGILKTNAICNQQINAIIPNESCTSEFIAFTIFLCRSIIELIANAPVVPIINKGEFSNIIIPIPPLSLQHSFASKVEAIEKQKELIKQSIAETELLFNSRMQYYFG